MRRVVTSHSRGQARVSPPFRTGLFLLPVFPVGDRDRSRVSRNGVNVRLLQVLALGSVLLAACAAPDAAAKSRPEPLPVEGQSSHKCVHVPADYLASELQFALPDILPEGTEFSVGFERDGNRVRWDIGADHQSLMKHLVESFDSVGRVTNIELIGAQVDTVAYEALCQAGLKPNEYIEINWDDFQSTLAALSASEHATARKGSLQCRAFEEAIEVDSLLGASEDGSPRTLQVRSTTLDSRVYLEITIRMSTWLAHRPGQRGHLSVLAVATPEIPGSQVLLIEDKAAKSWLLVAFQIQAWKPRAE